MRTYEEIVESILELPKFTVKNKPEHTKELLRRLGNPQERMKVIHVAGSNGKGSVCAFVESVLRQAGKRTGLFTSPHLVHIEERFALDGAPCSREILVHAARKTEQAAESMVRQGMPHPSFFEFIFAMGMEVFAEQKVEYAVLETGLGGRKDATNLVKSPVLTVITSISLEHTEILGTTISEIAAEKAGIIKAGVPVVYDASEPMACQVIEAYAQKQGSQTFPVRCDNIKILLNDGKKIAFSYDSGYDVTELEIPFAAPYQAQNAAVALQAVRCMAKREGISAQAVRRGFACAEWKGRMQQAADGVYFDGAHNLDGVERFLEAVGQVTDQPGILLFSMVKEKAYARAAELLLEKGNWEAVIVTSVPGERAVEAEELAELFRRAAERLGRRTRILCIDKIEKAYERALAERKPGQVLFCAGSLYLIGELERIAGGMECSTLKKN